MKISGFTIIKNALKNDYPLVESIRSILPVVDEMIVLVGDSTDNTESLIRAIGDPKIRIHHSTWDPTLRQGGEVLAVETDKAFALIDPSADWAFYLQADEVVHEKYLDRIRESCLQYKDDKRVDGLLFDYIHFYGTYDYFGDSRKWYNHEVRVIRNDKKIHAYRDAQGFRKNGSEKLRVKSSRASVYHYGWVKDPRQMSSKLKNVQPLGYLGALDQKVLVNDSGVYDYSDYDSLRLFKDDHPAVMKDRISRFNWKLNINPKKKKFKFKDALLYYFEKVTGLRPFSYTNYKILK